MKKDDLYIMGLKKFRRGKIMNQIYVEVIRLLQKEIHDLQRFVKQTNKNINVLGRVVVDLSQRVRSLEGEPDENVDDNKNT